MLSRDYNCRLLSTLKHSVDSRLSKYERMEFFQLATVLDPHFKLDWCADTEVERVKSILISKAEETFSQAEGPELLIPEREGPPSPKKLDLYL